MWKEILLNYGIFLLEILTIILAIFFVVMVIFKLSSESKEKKGELTITCLNKRYKDLQFKLETFDIAEKELKKLTKQRKKEEKSKPEIASEDIAKVYVLEFNGDMAASQVTSLREELNTILSIARPEKDEIVLKLESPGGMVHSYGLAASQLQRIKQKKIKLRIVVDKVAASGGYMMASVANEIIAAPFAIIGSIGVVANVPNIHNLLKKHDIDVDVMTAGEYKRTVTLFGEKTEKGVQKFQAELEETHNLFKDFITINRPSLTVEDVATGEHWFGQQALKLNLIDKIATSDDIIMEYLQQENTDVLEVKYTKKKTLLQKLGKQAENSSTNVVNNILQKNNSPFF